MEYLILILVLVIIATPITIILRKSAYKRINSEVENFLAKRNSTLEKELQTYIDSKNINSKVLSVKVKDIYKYNNKEFLCIKVIFKIDGQNNWYTGIISDSGSYTEFNKYNALTFYSEGQMLLKTIYKLPNKKINEQAIAYLPRLDNIYNFNINPDEKIIYNAIIKNFKTDYDISIGLNAMITITDKTIYIHNGLNSVGAGLWTIDLNNEIANYKREDMCMYINLTEIAIFGGSVQRICTGFILCFDNIESINRLEEIFNNIIE